MVSGAATSPPFQRVCTDRVMRAARRTPCAGHPPGYHSFVEFKWVQDSGMSACAATAASIASPSPLRQVLSAFASTAPASDLAVPVSRDCRTSTPPLGTSNAPGYRWTRLTHKDLRRKNRDALIQSASRTWCPTMPKRDQGIPSRTNS